MRLPDDQLYLTDRDGTRWRAHDAVFTGGRRRVVKLGNPSANTRYFRSAGGVVRACTFKRGDSRATDNSTLASQFAQSGFVAQMLANTSARRPR
jgi:hypothetical protein